MIANKNTGPLQLIQLPHQLPHRHTMTTQKLSSKDKAINTWATTSKLESVQLDAKSSDTVSINGLLRHLLTQKHLRRFCVMFRVTGYKKRNGKRPFTSLFVKYEVKPWRRCSILRMTQTFHDSNNLQRTHR